MQVNLETNFMEDVFQFFRVESVMQQLAAGPERSTDHRCKAFCCCDRDPRQPYYGFQPGITTNEMTSDLG